MPQVNITINSRQHEIACQEGEEKRVEELANLLNSEVLNIVDNIGQIGDVKLMVLAAITILDKNQDILDEATKTVESSTKKLGKILKILEENY